MPIRIELIDPINNPEWIEFLGSHEHTTIFHHPAWLKILSQQYGFSIFSACVYERGKIASGLALCSAGGISGRKRLLSLPFTDHCEPLIKDNTHLSALTDYLKSRVEQKKTGSIEVRSKLPEDSGFKSVSNAVLHSLKLDKPPDELFTDFNKSRVQRGINKAVKENLTGRISTSQDDMESFYSLHLKTRKKLGIPVQPKNFFRLFFEEIINKNLGFICIVEKEGTPLAAGIFAGFGKTLIYKYGASMPSMLRLKPNHLMFWTAISEACSRGFSYFDFGKSDNSGTGLREFKSGWASTETPLYYSYFPNAPTGRGVIALTENALAKIIRYSPSFVCRIIGELFYKFAA
jgi:hypothetical protein